MDDSPADEQGHGVGPQPLGKQEREAGTRDDGPETGRAPGARPGLFVPSQSTLFVAAPARGGVAEIRAYRIK